MTRRMKIGLLMPLLYQVVAIILSIAVGLIILEVVFGIETFRGGIFDWVKNLLG